MAKQAKRSSRRPPVQARSQATVEAILSGAVRVLDREGLEAGTTTRIAEVAGVSVGTLYQYFADRDAVLDALQDREFSRALELMQNVLATGNLTQSPRETVTAVVRGLASLYTSSPGLHRVLAIEGLRIVHADRVHAFDTRIIGIIRYFLAATGATVRRSNVDAAAFVAFQSVRATMLASLLERPPGLDMEVLTEEIVDLVLRYLVEEEPPKLASPAGRPRVPAKTRR